MEVASAQADVPSRMDCPDQDGAQPVRVNSPRSDAPADTPIPPQPYVPPPSRQQPPILPSTAPPHAADVRPGDTAGLWQVMRDTVRDADLRKVADAKEDLDNVLIFAGLFSAVVTTFVVDSYASLQPDNTEEIIFLMRQSLAQNYTLANGVLRPMIPLPGDLPFEVPLWALRVNGLWFASLIVSLSTASFGMLVKQWLSEYLAMGWITPEEQLRARQFRHQGLTDWKVFEIAAMLPLLLHLSLGLFFVGLCFYTAAASDLIGRSTFPLVAGWAFFALLTMFAPLLSPRCPYKIVLLKSALRLGRQYIGAYLQERIHRGFTMFAASARRLYNCTLLPVRLYIQSVRDVVADWADWIGNSSSILSYTLAPLLLIYVLLLKLFESLGTVLGTFSRDEDEEDNIMRRSYHVHELLLSVDKLVANDGPILETMVDVLRQTKSPPASITAFVLGCIRHRIGAVGALQIPENDQRIRGFLDLSTLSSGAWNHLVGLLSSILMSHEQASHAPTNVPTVPAFDETPDIWMANAAVILLSRSHPSLPDRRVLLSDPAMHARMLELSFGLAVAARWPQKDVFRLVWAAFSSVSLSDWQRIGWRRLPQIRGDTPNDVQKSVINTLLQTIWRDERDKTDSEPEVQQCTAEGTMLLLYILKASAPSLRDYEEGTWLYNRHLSLWGLPVLYVQDVAALLRPGYQGIASRLAAAVQEYPVLIFSVFNIYRVYVSRSLFDSRPLWKIIFMLGDGEARDPARQPIMRDLWSFLLECTEIRIQDAAAFPYVVHFAKLCLVLAQLGLSSLFADNDYAYASDWAQLAPMVRWAAEQAMVIDHHEREDHEESIKVLASQTLRSLESRLDGAHLPGALEEVLRELSAVTPRPSRGNNAGNGRWRRLSRLWSSAVSQQDSDSVASPARTNSERWFSINAMGSLSPVSTPSRSPLGSVMTRSSTEESRPPSRHIDLHHRMLSPLTIAGYNGELRGWYPIYSARSLSSPDLHADASSGLSPCTAGSAEQSARDSSAGEAHTNVPPHVRIPAVPAQRRNTVTLPLVHTTASRADVLREGGRPRSHSFPPVQTARSGAGPMS
ncbi:hypothetical protein PsYK624_083270 [Phanerochaete sordida]|uniref:DUF6535 domain-containing protein n=1 Tax=Phanerochaete sordida TaxID=48140 RepID=A0A9P3GD64_9APHY|nr:hypothetical protein PsYK624_083270 [Phanerochaete sordida]